MTLPDPEFPIPEEILPEDEQLDAADQPSVGDGLTEAAGVVLDEEVERVVQPEPVGD